MKGLRIYHLNIHSLSNKLDELRLFCNEYKPHVLSLNETWLDENILDDELHLTSYNIIRRDRDSFGGGVAVYIDEHLQFNHINMEARPNIEAIWFEFIPTKSKKIFFNTLYRQPSFLARGQINLSELFEGRKWNHLIGRLLILTFELLT